MAANYTFNLPCRVYNFYIGWLIMFKMCTSSRASHKNSANIGKKDILDLNKWSEFEIRSSKTKIEVIINGKIVYALARSESDAMAYNNIELYAPSDIWIKNNTLGLIKHVRLCPIDE